MSDHIRLDSVHIGDLARAAFQYMHEIGAHFGAKLGDGRWCTVNDQLWIVTARHDRHGLATYGVEVRPPGPIGDPVARLALERIGEPGVSATVSAFQEPPPPLFNGLVKRLGLLNDQPQGKGGAPRDKEPAPPHKRKGRRASAPEPIRRAVVLEWYKTKLANIIPRDDLAYDRDAERVTMADFCKTKNIGTTTLKEWQKEFPEESFASDLERRRRELEKGYY